MKIYYIKRTDEIYYEIRVVGHTQHFEYFKLFNNSSIPNRKSHILRSM